MVRQMQELFFKKLYTITCLRYHKSVSYTHLDVYKRQVLIHDGARAFITPELIEFCIEQVKKDKSCVMGMPVKDTIKIVDNNCYAVSTPPRSSMWQIQTPQCFITDVYKRQEYKKLYDEAGASCSESQR